VPFSTRQGRKGELRDGACQVGKVNRQTSVVECLRLENVRVGLWEVTESWRNGTDVM
jgi:hypothetical protein